MEIKAFPSKNFFNGFVAESVLRPSTIKPGSRISVKLWNCLKLMTKTIITT